MSTMDTEEFAVTGENNNKERESKIKVQITGAQEVYRGMWWDR